MNHSIKEGYDLVFIARVTINEADYKGVRDSLEKAVKRAGLKNSGVAYEKSVN